MKLAVLMLTLFVAIPALAQDIYKWKDEKGQWHFSQTPPAAAVRDASTIKDNSLPEKMKTDEPCIPFKVGETRTPKAISPSTETPQISLKDIQIKLIEKGSDWTRFSWQAKIVSTSAVRERVAARLTLYDCSGFPVIQDETRIEPVAPGGELSVGGRPYISGAGALTVGRFTLGAGALKPSPETQAVRFETIPDVRVLWTRFEQSGPSEISLIGEVFNAGLAKARNVQIRYMVNTKENVKLVEGKQATSPADIEPGASAIFKTRIAALQYLAGHTASTEVEFLK
jgi:hypothetical protein